MQALRGMSIVHWDAMGLSALALVALASLVTAVLHAGSKSGTALEQSPSLGA